MNETKEKLIELLGDLSCRHIIKDSCGFCQYGCEDMCQNHALADHLIANGVTIAKWIPVTERLPKPFTPVLVYRQSFGTLPPYIKVDKMTLWYDDTPIWTDEIGTWKAVVTHWMPLPEPPKGE